nr:PTS sugar transporter subunit IIA [Anaerostipes hadrus]
MTLLGEEILQVLDNIKISTGENIKNKKQLIEYAGELFARNETTATEITFALSKRENIASTFIPSMNALFLHCETKGIRHCRFGFVYLNDEIIEDGQPIKGAILMLVPQGDGSKVYREVMSEISGALAEKDQIITYLFDKNRNAVEAELETSLGNYYENKMKRR